jgi:hypothetical protein
MKKKHTRMEINLFDLEKNPKIFNVILKPKMLRILEKAKALGFSHRFSNVLNLSFLFLYDDNQLITNVNLKQQRLNYISNKQLNFHCFYNFFLT